MNRAKRILLLLVFQIILYLFTPSWVLFAGFDELRQWFPTFGFFIFFYFNYLSFPLFTLLVFLYIFFVRKKKYISFLFDKKTQFSFICVLAIFFSQFFYCFKYQEFFPAVMLPSFSTGVQSNEIELTDGFILLYSNNQRFKIDIRDLFKSTPVISIFKKRREIDILKIDEFSDEYKNWIKNKVLVHSPLESIDSLSIFKELKYYDISSRKYIKNQSNKVLSINYVE